MTGEHGHDIAALEKRLEEHQPLAEHEVKTLLRAHKIPVPNGRIAHDRKEARAAAKALKPPFALKVTGPEITHKTELKGVVLNLETAAKLMEAYDEMAPRFPDNPLLVEEMAPSGLEIILGLIHDPQFGPSLMVGLGGIFAEVLEDVAFRVVPVDRQDCSDMLDELKGGKVLSPEGFRGKIYDRNALLYLMCNIGGDWAAKYGHYLQSMDLNPVFVYQDGQGLVVVDAKMVPQPDFQDARDGADGEKKENKKKK